MGTISSVAVLQGILKGSSHGNAICISFEQHSSVQHQSGASEDISKLDDKECTLMLLAKSRLGVDTEIFVLLLAHSA